MKILGRHDRMTPARWAALVALLLAVTAGLFLVFSPAYHGVSESVSSSGVVTSSSQSASLIAVKGFGIVFALCVPIALAALGLLAAAGRRRVLVWVPGAALLCFVVLTGFSIGLLYLPAAIALLLSAGLMGSSRRLVRQV
jgi:hypothetical protein